ncbi:MAG: DoxX family membrane protein [Paracoccaceae bacterium]
MLISLYNRLQNSLSALGAELVPFLARLTFAGVLAGYFWASAGTKVGEGLLGFLSPSAGAYAQIFPKAFEAVGYDAGQLGLFHWAVAVAGTVAEFVLPLLILIGLLTRLAALGMIGFVTVQSLTDIYGHGVGGDDLGRWFDRASDALIADQRGLWVFLLLTIALLGAGRLSLDRLLFGRS